MEYAVTDSIPSNRPGNETEMIIDGQRICGYTGSSGVLKIPGYVTSIADEAFRGNLNLLSVEIPGSIKEIPSGAFWDCKNLQDVILHDGIETISARAFQGCSSMESIVLPDSISQIDDYAFIFCKNLKTIALPDSVTSIGDDVFNGCSSLESATLPAGWSVITDSLFKDCRALHSIKSSSLTEIHRYGLSRTPIRELILPDLTYCGFLAFEYSGIEKLVIGSKLESVRPFMLDDSKHLKYLFIDDTVTEIESPNDGFANDTDIPFFHVSSSLLKGLDDHNKLNALRTFLMTKEDYSSEGQKRWMTYIKSQKIKLLKLCIRANDAELLEKLLAVVVLKEKDLREIRSAITNETNPAIHERIKTISLETRTPRKTSDQSIVGQLIAAIPRSTSGLKKTNMLGFGVLFGTVDEINKIIQKYQPFEYTREAALLAFYLRNEEKLRIILRSSEPLGDYYTSSISARYYLSRPSLSESLTSRFLPYHLEDRIQQIISFVRDTVNYEYSEKDYDRRNGSILSMIREFIANSTVLSEAVVLNAAISGENYSLADVLIDAGFSIQHKHVSGEIGAMLNRMLGDASLETIRKYLPLYASSNPAEQFILTDTHIYDQPDVLTDPDIFELVCSGFDIGSFSKKKLLDFAAMLTDPRSIRLLVEKGFVKINKPLLFEMINAADKGYNPACIKCLQEYYALQHRSETTEATEISLSPKEQLKKDWSFSAENGEIIIKGYKGNKKTVKVPDFISGKPVTSIDWEAFSPKAPRISADVRKNREGIETVELPNQFRSFAGFYPYYKIDQLFGHSFRQFVIPEGSQEYPIELVSHLLEFGDVVHCDRAGDYLEENSVIYAKSKGLLVGPQKSSRIRSLTIPKSIRHVCHDTFKQFAYLEELTIESIVTKYISPEDRYIFPSIQFPKSVKKVMLSGYPTVTVALFSSCNVLEEVLLGEGVKTLADNAFAQCSSLRSLYIPRSVSKIGDNAAPKVYERNILGQITGSRLPEAFCIYCYRGSFAEQYAIEQKLPYKTID